MYATIIVFTLKVLQMINCFLIFEYVVAIFRFLTYNYIESGIEASWPDRSAGSDSELPHRCDHYGNVPGAIKKSLSAYMEER